MIQKALKLIETQEIKVTGAVINNINIMRDDYYYYYHTYYSDYYSDTSDSANEGTI